MPPSGSLFDMSSPTDLRPATNGESNSVEAPGFTAVNGRSPTEDPAQLHGHKTTPPQLDRRVSIGSNGKRKHPSSTEQSPTSPSSQFSNSNKRRRSPSKSQSDNYISIINGAQDGNPQLPSPNEQYVESREESWATPSQQSYNTDAQFAEAIQRGTQEMSQELDQSSSPDQQYGEHPQAHIGMGHTPTPGSITPAMAAPMLAKQRKRNFSNRTKTGCLTCRERKKKCDEGKPTCTNCERGGFLCKGYAQTGALYKPPPMSQPAPIQAKNGYYETAQQPHYSYQVRPVHTGPDMYETSPVSAGRGRPPAPENDRDNRAIPHPDPSLRNGGGYPGPNTWQDDNRRPFPTEPGLHRPEYNHIPQFPMSTRDNNPKLPPPPPPLQHLGRHGSHGSHTLAPQNMAQLALQQPQPPPPPPPQSRPPPVQQSEKDKMLSGYSFNHLDPQLKDERQKCKLLLRKYNRDSLDWPEIERRECLHQIIEADNTNSPRRRLGERVTVDAPFYCEYGYNVELGDDVEIGANVTIIDAAKVVIGKRTIIEPGVVIDTQIPEMESTPVGMKRPRKAKPIYIHNDVYIGANSVIRPHTQLGDSLTIQHGVNILAGSLVSNVMTVQNNLNWDHPHSNPQPSMRSRQGS